MEGTADDQRPARTIRSVNASYRRWLVAGGLVLIICGFNTWMFFHISTLAPTHTAAASTPPPPTPSQPAAVLARTPADTLITSGTASQLLSTYRRNVTDVNAAHTQSGTCLKPAAGAYMVSAASAETARSITTVTISVYRAGQAAAAFTPWVNTIKDCGQLVSTPGQDKVTVTTGGTDASTALSATRVGDVIVTTSISSFSSDPESESGQLNRQLSADITSLLGASCADPATATSPDDPARSPYSPAWRGYSRDTVISIPDAAPPVEASVIASVLRTPTHSTWTPPAAVAHPDLAAYLSGGGRGPAPVFVDPQTLHAPDDVKPASRPDAPAPPTLAEHSTHIGLPAVDSTGPGCGWAFTGQQPAVVNPDTVTAAAREATLNTLATLNKAAAADLLNAITWPQQYRAWATGMVAWNNWSAYDTAVQDAHRDSADAQAAYQQSLASLLTPRPASTPTASASASPTTSPATSHTPSPTPSSASGASS